MLPRPAGISQLSVRRQADQKAGSSGAEEAESTGLQPLLDHSAPSVGPVLVGGAQAGQRLELPEQKEHERAVQAARGLVGWVLLKLRLQLPSAHSNKPGPYAHLWGTWSDSAMQDQLSCLEARLQATPASNRRNGQLGTLKHTLQDELRALLKKAERKAARRAACAHAAKAV